MRPVRRRFPGSGEGEIAAQMVRHTCVDFTTAAERQLLAIELSNQIVAKDRCRVLQEHRLRRQPDFDDTIVILLGHRMGKKKFAAEDGESTEKKQPQEKRLSSH